MVKKVGTMTVRIKTVHGGIKKVPQYHDIGSTV